MTEHTSRNDGRNEFLSVLDKIHALFKAGFDRKATHGILKDKGILTISYATFCRQLNQHKDKLPRPTTLGSGLLAESDRTRALKNPPAAGRPSLKSKGA